MAFRTVRVATGRMASRASRSTELAGAMCYCFLSFVSLVPSCKLDVCLPNW